MNESPIKIERIFNAPIEKLWNALTIPAEMKLWYFDIPEFKPEVGCKFQFSGGPSLERQYLHLCEVTEVVSNQKLTHSWRYDGYAGNSFVSYELISENGKTRVIFSHSGIESFPAENSDLAKENFFAGWDHIINMSLKNYLKND